MMTEPTLILNIIRNRRSIRKFKKQPVEDEKILLILEAARWAPSSGNLQNWRFIVVRDPEKRKKLAEYSFNQPWVAEAPVVIVVLSDTKTVRYFYGERGEKLYAIQNTAAAIQNMLLMAHALGLGSVWIGAFDEKKVKELLEIPEDYDVHALVCIGYPNENPKSERKELDELVYWEKFGNKERFEDWFPLYEKLQEYLKDLNKLKEQIKKIKDLIP